MKVSRHYIGWLYFLVIISSIGTYIPNYLGIEISVVAAKGISVVTLIVFFIFVSKKANIKYKRSYDGSFLIILCSLFYSILMCVAYHDSDFLSCMVATSMYIIWALYFIIKKVEVDKEDVNEMITILGYVNIFVILSSFITLPTPLFGSFEIDTDRGGMRIRSGDVDWVILFMCFSLFQIGKDKSYKYVLNVALCFITVLSTVTRQTIFICFLLILLYVIKHAKIKVKFLGVVLLAISLIFVLRTEVAQNIIDMTIKQHEISLYQEDDVRFEDIKFFAVTGQKNVLTHLFGNGVWSTNNSEFGKEMQKKNHITVDVGYFGYYYHFGLISLMALLLLLIRLIFKKNSYENRFLNFFFFAYALKSIVGGSILYPNEILIFIIMVRYSMIPSKINV